MGDRYLKDNWENEWETKNRKRKEKKIDNKGERKDVKRMTGKEWEREIFERIERMNTKGRKKEREGESKI